MLTGINPAYFRFKGRAELRVYKGNVLVDKHSAFGSLGINVFW
jgi:hypothetical protein